MPALVAAEEVMVEHVVPTPLFAPPLDEELAEARVKVQQQALYPAVRPQFFGQCGCAEVVFTCFSILF